MSYKKAGALPTRLRACVDADLGLANVDVMFGLQPTHNLADVISGESSLQDIIVNGPAGVIKVLSTERDINRFRVVTNMTRQGGDGSGLFQKLLRVTDRFLDVSLDHAGSVPFDDRVWRAVQLQTPLPGSR